MRLQGYDEAVALLSEKHEKLRQKTIDELKEILGTEWNDNFELIVDTLISHRQVRYHLNEAADSYGMRHFLKANAD